jgi:MFS transporter, AAHS family, 4-hydroxybenzoate transporter
MGEKKIVHVPDIVNGKSVGLYQLAVIALCGMLMFIDGFDTQAISYMAPFMAKEWGIPRDALGPIFSSALVGLMVGYLLLAPLSDRFGHRRMLLASTILFSLFTLATTRATNVDEVVALRFMTGLGLGAAAPSAVALTGEYSPARLRATAVLAIYCGFSFGFVAAGGAAATILPAYGWRSLLWVGSLVPLGFAVALWIWLPESLLHMVRKGAETNRIWAALRKIDPRLPIEVPAGFTTEAEVKRNAVESLFRDGRATGTLLLWFVFILNLAAFYALQSWLPSILSNLDFSLDAVVLATSLMTTGGIVAAFIIGPAMDRIGAYASLAALYAVGVLFTVLMGAALSQPEWVLLTASFFAGFCISGGQKSAIALAAVFYPAPIRSTGVGWALGIGRIGGIAGPMLVQLLLHWKFSPEEILYAAAIFMLLTALSVAWMARLYGRSSSQAGRGHQKAEGKSGDAQRGDAGAPNRNQPADTAQPLNCNGIE